MGAWAKPSGDVKHTERVDMIQIDVIVLQRRTAEKIDSWGGVTAGDGRLLARYDDLSIPAEDAWRRLSLTIHEKACDAAREFPYSHLEVDVFLLVRGRLVERIPDEDGLKKIVNAAHHHTWGGNVYLTWVGSSEAEFRSLYQGSELTLENWVRALIDSGVTDLIEIQKEDDKPGPDLYRVLHESALKSEKRLEKLRRLVNDGGWKPILRYQASAIKAFIKKFVGEDQASAGYKNLAVFYDLNRSSDWGELLDFVPKDHDGNLFIAVNSQKTVNNLEAVLKGQLPGAELFYFNSILEWLYSFLRLNPARRPKAPKSPTEPPQDDEAVEWVEATEGARISSKPNAGDLCLLVTSAFNLERELAFDFNADSRNKKVKHCLDAATEIGDVRRNLPFYVYVEVHHSIICERLPEILKDRSLKDRSFTAWLHIGHGERGGLVEESNQFVSADRWTGCFHGYKGSLQSVMFSACVSSELARKFAKLGVPVTVGFESEVLTDAARKLSAMVMPSALQTGDRQTAILEGFRDAVIELRRTSYVEVNGEGRYEDKHYSDSNPKAFAAKLKSP